MLINYRGHFEFPPDVIFYLFSKIILFFTRIVIFDEQTCTVTSKRNSELNLLTTYNAESCCRII